MKYKIVYYNKEVEQNIFRLPNTLFARYIHITELMEDFGSNIGTYVTY